MQDNKTMQTQPSRKASTAVLRMAGAGYGVFFGLGLGLLVWGYDSFTLARASADLAWGTFSIGFPCALVVGGVIGYLGIRLPGLGWTTLLWAVSLGALTWGAGHLPFEGFDFLTGMADPRFAGLTLRPYLEAHQVRTLIAIIPNVALGFGIGYLETLAVDSAWDHTNARGRMGLRSWLTLMLGLLVASVPAWIIQSLIMQPTRDPQLRVANLVATTLQGGVEAVKASGQNGIEAQNHGQHFTPRYTVQLVEFSTLTQDLHTSYVTVAFDNNFALQCIVMGELVTYCEDLTKKFDARIGDMIYAGLTGEERWLSDPTKTFVVEDEVVDWLRSRRERLSESYSVIRAGQKGPITLMTVQFDTGFRMTCRFSGAAITRAVVCEED